MYEPVVVKCKVCPPEEAAWQSGLTLLSQVVKLDIKFHLSSSPN